MGNHKDGSPKFPQIFFQPGNHLRIQMIGRLVQQQHIKIQSQYFSQSYLAPLSSGKIFYRRIILQNPQLIQIALYFPLLLTVLDIRQNRGIFRKLGILRQIGNPQIILLNNLSLIRFFQSGCHFQKRGFSRTIYTNNTDFVPFLNTKGRMVKNHFFSVNFADIFYV